MWGGLQRSSSIFKRLTLQSKIPGSCTYALNNILTILCIVERDNPRQSQKHPTTSLLAVANNLTIIISRGEVFKHVQKPDAVIENRRKTHDQSQGLTTSCATSYDFQGPIFGHKYVCWLVSGSCLLGVHNILNVLAHSTVYHAQNG